MRVGRFASWMTLASLLILGMAGGVHAQLPAPDSGPVIFGLDEDTTGPAAPFGRVSGRAFRDAVAYLNERGGILGRPIRIIAENDESDGTKTPAVTRKLIEAGAHMLFYSTGAAAILQAKPIVRDAKVVSFTQTTVSATVASPPANEYMFGLANPAGDVTGVLCAAWKATGIKKLAVFSDNSASVDVALKAYMPTIEGCVSVVAQDRGPADATDLTGAVVRLRAYDPDAVFVISNGGAFEALAFQTIKRQLPRAKRFSSAGLGNQPDAWKLAAPGGLEGLVYTASVTLSNPRTKEIDAYIRGRHPEIDAITAFDAWAWQAVMLAKLAIEKAGGVNDRERLLAAMHEIKGEKAYYGQEGFTVSYRPDKHIAPDGLCGLILNAFGPDNRPLPTPWPDYQPSC